MTALVRPPAITTMQAALFYQPGDIRFEEIRIPEPGPGEVVIRVDTALTCGTDLKTYRRGHPVLLKNYPSPFGHECAGTVFAVGKGVTNFTPGDRVVAANSAPCQACFYCRKEKFNLCENLDLLNGAYAEYLKIPERIVRENTLKLADNVSFEAAAFAEPLSVSIRGLEACNIQPGDTVGVIGLGAVGQLLIKLAKRQGAAVIGMGRNPLKREVAKTFAEADVVLDLTQHTDADAIVLDFTPEGKGFDVVIEAVGLPLTWEQSIRMVRRGGLVNLFGGCPSGTQINLDTSRLHYDEITLISLFHHTPAYFRKALNYIETGKLDPTPLITMELPMNCVTHALELVAEGKAIKVALKPDA